MSGIVGLVTFDGSPVDRRSLESMTAAAPHRGDDGVLTWSGSGAAFAYQRSRVLADAGDERGLVESGGLVCVADARLDNTPELAASLWPHGRPDVHVADAEILLKAYQLWGSECVGRLVGDFAFVIWDIERRTLFAARDTMAMRSLAYQLQPGRLVAVATEVKQLLALPDVPVRLHEPAVLADLLGTFGTPAWSFYDGISNLAPGHVLLVDENGHSTQRFWFPDPTARLRLDDEAEYVDLWRARFVDAVAARLRTNAPAGILLSGGVDSGSVAATAGWLLQRGAVAAPSVHSFSWAFDHLTQCDERGVSSLIADHYGFSATDIAADRAGPLAEYPAYGPDRDDPFLGAFQPLIERSLAMARGAGVGVMLGGDRGDLLVGNTGWNYIDLVRARRWEDLLGLLEEHRRVTGDSWQRILRRHLFDAVALRIRRRSLLQWLQWAGRGAKEKSPSTGQASWLISSPALDDVRAASGIVERPVGFDAARAQRFEWIFTQLHVRGMAWSERTYARYGLAFADPFSDRRLVDLALALPPVVINRPGDLTKPLMRAAMRGVMPENARRRARKVIPRPLYEQGLRDARATIHDLTAKPLIAAHGWVDAERWRSHFETWLSGRGELRGEWWWALGVEIWLRRHW